ncbi:small ribosomal subunit protein uS5m-like [Saccostrea cucullata]|uniref:small ribosomal subunit protein uS5m-like n=1 Tax=Saccostrea cuccullata TaxID=36930 RepID=UPI002ED071A7
MILARVGFDATKNAINWNNLLQLSGCSKYCQGQLCLLSHLQSRNYSFVTTVSDDDLWGSVTSVSAAGAKRGRAKSTKKRINLHIGQKPGYGKEGLQFPGLNTRILSRENAKSTGIRRAEEFDVLLEDLRQNRKSTKRSQRKQKYVNPLLRGYTSAYLHGTSLGPPAPVREEKFEGFDSRLLQLKKVTNITADQGKKFSYRAVVAVGNGNGLAGFAVAKANFQRAAGYKARDKAGQQLMFIERYNDHTIYHDTYAQVHCTKVFAKRKFEGYGVIAHRVIKDLCLLSGIKDIYVKTEGNTKNAITMATAFFNAVTHQETHQELANRTNMHVVELSDERNQVPVVLASPEDGKVQEKYYGSERDVYDLDTLYTKGKLHWIKPKIRPVWERLGLTSYRRKLDTAERRRGQDEAQRERRLCGLDPSREERIHRDQAGKRKKE